MTDNNDHSHEQGEPEGQRFQQHFGMADGDDEGEVRGERSRLNPDAVPDEISGQNAAKLGSGISLYWLAAASAAALIIGSVGTLVLNYSNASKVKPQTTSQGTAVDPNKTNKEPPPPPPPPGNPQSQIAGLLGPNSGAIPPPVNCPGVPAGVAVGIDCKPLPPDQTTMTNTPGAPGAGKPITPAMQRAAARQQMADAARRAPVMAFSASYQPVPQAGGSSEGIVPAPTSVPTARPVLPVAPAALPGGSALPGNGLSVGATDFTSKLGHARIETVRATMVANRSFLLAAGTLIPCTMQTAINSTQAGFVACVINHDVYSEDGKVVLLDKGTKVLGQYSGGIQQGQARLFVVWIRALTPRGVAIDLGSPAADELGRAGVAGGVDSQFWARFGAALMLSVIEDATNIVGRSVASYGSNTTQVPSSAAQTVLQNTINIPPVLKKNQGDLASIFVAKDFDFSSVYGVRLRR
ncbi:type IV secretion system protein VirB10 [Novosphingobium acidiphilum]|uniref:type IV secretion system protein VirB10 n=1 Tax=Novosphingobium acidiphilum TaxID=505248 RepID=UPI001FE1D437|nr:type IV secretion system protein VirB10 [Novosphingobium acidiphilum]